MPSFKINIKKSKKYGIINKEKKIFFFLTDQNEPSIK